jgi:hypothetical protein
LTDEWFFWLCHSLLLSSWLSLIHAWLIRKSRKN